jgi:hypothetical protein
MRVRLMTASIRYSWAARHVDHPATSQSQSTRGRSQKRPRKGMWTNRRSLRYPASQNPPAPLLLLVSNQSTPHTRSYHGATQIVKLTPGTQHANPFPSGQHVNDLPIPAYEGSNDRRTPGFGCVTLIRFIQIILRDQFRKYHGMNTPYPPPIMNLRCVKRLGYRVKAARWRQMMASRRSVP